MSLKPEKRKSKKRGTKRKTDFPSAITDESLMSQRSMTPITSFMYKGLEFKVYNNHGFTLLVKQGRRIVVRDIWHSIDAKSRRVKVLREIALIKEGVDRGYGLNIDYPQS